MQGSTTTNNSSDRLLLYRCIANQEELSSPSLRLRNDFQQIRVTSPAISPNITSIDIPLRSANRQAPGSQVTVAGSTVNIDFIYGFGRFDNLITGIVGGEPCVPDVYERSPTVDGEPTEIVLNGLPAVEITQLVTDSTHVYFGTADTGGALSNGDTFEGVEVGSTLTFVNIFKVELFTAVVASITFGNANFDPIEGKVIRDIEFTQPIISTQLANVTAVSYVEGTIGAFQLLYRLASSTNVTGRADVTFRNSANVSRQRFTDATIREDLRIVQFKFRLEVSQSEPSFEVAQFSNGELSSIQLLDAMGVMIGGGSVVSITSIDDISGRIDTAGAIFDVTFGADVSTAVIGMTSSFTRMGQTYLTSPITNLNTIDYCIATIADQPPPLEPGESTINVARQRFSDPTTPVDRHVVQFKTLSNSANSLNLGSTRSGLYFSFYDEDGQLLATSRIVSNTRITDLGNREDFAGDVYDVRFFDEISDATITDTNHIGSNGIRTGSSLYYFDFELATQQARGTLTPAAQSTDTGNFGNLAVAGRTTTQSRTLTDGSTQNRVYNNGRYEFAGTCILDTLSINLSSGEPINCSLTGLARYFADNSTSTSIDPDDATSFGYTEASDSVDLGTNTSFTNFRIVNADSGQPRANNDLSTLVNVLSASLSINNGAQTIGSLGSAGASSIPILSSQEVNLTLEVNKAANTELLNAVKSGQNLEVSFNIKDKRLGKITITLFNALVNTPSTNPSGQDEVVVETYELTALISDVYDSTSLQVDFVPNEVIL